MAMMKEFVEYLDFWEKSGKRGLTKETFLAVRQICLAAADVAEYLQQKEDFVYVLLGQIQSDPIVKRFGWYRQLSGGTTTSVSGKSLNQRKVSESSAQ